MKPLGFVEASLREALLAHASLLVMLSPFESLSMVLLEAWNHGVPALVNARCDVLRGQVRRAGGGAYYRNYDEFSASRRCSIGRSWRSIWTRGREYVDRHYRWPDVMRTLEGFLASVGTARENPVQP